MLRSPRGRVVHPEKAWTNVAHERAWISPGTNAKATGSPVPGQNHRLPESRSVCVRSRLPAHVHTKGMSGWIEHHADVALGLVGA